MCSNREPSKTAVIRSNCSELVMFKVALMRGWSCNQPIDIKLRQRNVFWWGLMSLWMTDNNISVRLWVLMAMQEPWPLALHCPVYLLSIELLFELWSTHVAFLTVHLSSVWNVTHCFPSTLVVLTVCDSIVIIWCLSSEGLLFSSAQATGWMCSPVLGRRLCQSFLTLPFNYMQLKFFLDVFLWSFPSSCWFFLISFLFLEN